ncbi:MAG: hypothetical protein K2J99_02400 [Lachnospiraceae bacterium]|nr:hypothetical protein [Lachnospiraceae bacterium]
MKKITRRLVSLLLTVVMVAAVTACGTGNGGTGSDNGAAGTDSAVDGSTSGQDGES